MQEANDSTVLGRFDGEAVTHFGVTSNFSRSESRFIVRTDGPDGRLGDHEVAYTFGVDPLQQYLVPFPGGRLQVLPFAWDARPARDGGQRWFHLYPDQPVPHDDELHWTGRNQNWNSMCAECHSTGVRKNYRLAEDRFETSWTERNVACEACHGPGSAHVAWARSGLEAAPARGGLVGLGRAEDATWILDPEARIAHRRPPRTSHEELEACARCHSRRSPLREGYVHGRPLADTHRPVLLEEGLYHADGQIEGEVYEYGSFLQSRMYARGVSCSDCHDPHGATLRAEGNALCAGCHRPAHYDAASHHFHAPGGPGSRCVECHMPTKVYMGVDVRHDHGFRVPRPDLSLALGTPNACTSCHGTRPARWAADAVATWYGVERRPRHHFGEALDAGRRAREGAEAALVSLAGDSTQPAIARATALSLLREFLSARSATTLERSVADADPLVRAAAAELAGALDPAERLRRIAALLRDPIRWVRIQAARSLAPVPVELWQPAERAALGAALAEYREAERASAERPEAHLNLGVLHAELGESEQARREYEIALRLDPRFVPAYVNLADLERLRERDDLGERLLRRALQLAPQSADVRHALGLLLVRRQRLPEALEALREAAQLAPARARYAYVHAMALHSAGRSEQATGVLEQAHRSRPAEREPLLGLASIHADRGERSTALRFARELAELVPGDPTARALLERLEAQPEH